MYYPKVTLLSHPTKEGPKGLGQFLIVCNMDSKTYFTAWEKFEERFSEDRITDIKEFDTLPKAMADFWEKVANYPHSALVGVTMEWFEGEQLPLIKVEDTTHETTNTNH